MVHPPNNALCYHVPIMPSTVACALKSMVWDHTSIENESDPRCQMPHATYSTKMFSNSVLYCKYLIYFLCETGLQSQENRRTHNCLDRNGRTGRMTSGRTTDTRMGLVFSRVPKDL